MLVDEPRLDPLGVDAPHLEQQMVARVDPAGMHGERREQPELARVSRTSTPSTSARTASCSIVSGPHTVVARRLGRAAEPATNAFALAASTFGDTGFVDEVDRAQPVADELVELVLERRDEDHRHVLAGRLQPAQHLEAVDPGQPHVEQDEARRRAVDRVSASSPLPASSTEIDSCSR